MRLRQDARWGVAPEMDFWERESIGMKKLLLIICGAIIFSAISADFVSAQSFPTISVQIGDAESGADLSTSLQILLLFTVLTLAPSIIIMMTSFIRIVVTLSFVRQAMGAQQLPPNHLLVSLALIITFFIMSPVATRSYEMGIKPYMDEKIGKEEAFTETMRPVREFMLAQTREKDLALFVSLAGLEAPDSPDDIPLRVLVPGYVISELRLAFQIAFIIFVPFLAIDMVVASVLMSMGMMMLPPVMISLPFKVLLFVLVDGWYLIIKSLVQSFKVV